MGKTVLGIHHSGPIATAALVKDGRVVAASPQERFSRIKHDHSFPHLAAEFCLERAGLGYPDLDAVAIGWNPGENAALKYRAGHSDWMRYPGEWLASVPNHLLPRLARPVRGSVSHFDCGPDGPFNVHFVDHHLCHARLSYETSGFERCAILVADGWSEQKVTSAYVASPQGIELLWSVEFPNSLGCLYAALTDFLGFRAFRDEWKLMGLAAYGDAAKFPQMDKLLRLEPQGKYELDLSYFDFYNFDRGSYFSPKMSELLGPARQGPAPLEQRHCDLAAAGQLLFEKAMIHCLEHLRRVSDCDQVCISGGTAMNSLFNGKVVDMTSFERCHVSFAPDDSGNSLGAALEVSVELGQAVQARGLGAALGASFEADQVAAALERYKIPHRRVEDRAGEAARLLAQDKIVGWFQGRAEFGQRALGHRSILAAPLKAETKDLINASVKYREKFRPFAPMLLWEDVGRFFETTDPDPVAHMEKVFCFQPQMAAQVPAVVHQDGTGRLQSVDRQAEPLLAQLLESFGRLTGVPVLLNTSFNLKGEPIVNSPEDALATFFRSGLDALLIEDCLIEKG